MRHQLDLRTLAYLVCGPLLVAGLFGLLGTVEVQDGFDTVSCGSVLAHSPQGKECDDAVSSRGDWSYPVAVLGVVGLVAAVAVGRKPQNGERPRHPGEETGA